MDSEIFEMLPMIFVIIAIYGVLIIGGLVSYILRALGIMRMSASRGLQNGWLGFIPLAAEYQLGKISGEVDAGKRKIKTPGLWLAIFPAIVYGIFFTIYFALIFSMVGIAESSRWDEPSVGAITGFFIGIIVIYILLIIGSILIYLLHGLVVHRIFSCYGNDQQPVFHMLICLFVPFGEAILLYRYGNKPIINRPSYMNVYTHGYPNYQQPYYYGQQPVYPGTYQQPPQPPHQNPAQYQPPQPPQQNPAQYPQQQQQNPMQYQQPQSPPQNPQYPTAGPEHTAAQAPAELHNIPTQPEQNGTQPDSQQDNQDNTPKE